MLTLFAGAKPTWALRQPQKEQTRWTCFFEGTGTRAAAPMTSSHQAAHVTHLINTSLPRFYINSVPVSPLKILYENKRQHSAKCTSHFKLLVSKYCFKTNKTCLQDTPLAPPCVCTFKWRNTPPSSSSLNVQDRASFSFQPKILQGKPLFLKLNFFLNTVKQSGPYHQQTKTSFSMPSVRDPRRNLWFSPKKKSNEASQNSWYCNNYIVFCSSLLKLIVLH